METLEMDVPNLLALGGMLIALLSAIYSCRAAVSARQQANSAETSVREARIQNRIGIHSEKLQAYKALLAFRGRTIARGVHFEPEATWALYEHAQLAEFYFSTEIATNLDVIVGLSLDIQASRDQWSENAGVPPEEQKTLVESSYRQLDTLRKLIEATNTLMREELRLVESEPLKQET